MNRFFCRLIACFLITGFLLLTPISAFSMDTAFIKKPEVWYDRQDVVYTPEISLGKYNGAYSYYIDAENHCFYLHISYTEKSLKDSGNDIKAEFEIKNRYESYDFYIDKDGFISPDDQVKNAFNLEYNFGEDSAQGQEIYLGLEFINKNDITVDNLVSFSIIVNSTSYSLANDLTLPFCVEETTTNKSEKENTTTQKSNTTKRGNNTTKRSNTSRSSTEKTTKFKYIAPEKSQSAGKYEVQNVENENDSDNFTDEEQSEDSVDDTVEILTEEENEATLPKQSKLLIAVAVGSFLTGVAVLIYNNMKARKSSKDN